MLLDGFLVRSEECDQEIHELLGTFGSRVAPYEQPLPPAPRRPRDPLGFDLRTEFYRLYGVVAIAAPGNGSLCVVSISSSAFTASPMEKSS